MALRREHFLIVFIVFFVDQLSKFLVRSYFVQQVKIVSFLQISFVRNVGVAFGFLNSEVFRWPLVAVSVLVLGLLWHHSQRASDGFVLVCFALIIAGIAGNLVDRVFFGSVTDFIDVMVWPVFNLADSALTIGVSGLVYKEFV